jgi:hypothetical protein
MKQLADTLVFGTFLSVRLHGSQSRCMLQIVYVQYRYTDLSVNPPTLNLILNHCDSRTVALMMEAVSTYETSVYPAQCPRRLSSSMSKKFIISAAVPAYFRLEPMVLSSDMF